MLLPVNTDESVCCHVAVDGWLGTLDKELHCAEWGLHLENIVPTNRPVGVGKILD